MAEGGHQSDLIQETVWIRMGTPCTAVSLGSGRHGRGAVLLEKKEGIALENVRDRKKSRRNLDDFSSLF
ncbi:MAG: hypothetical protein J6I64_03040, partial [Lachnospiraceae bacterium]|nr:hypothetical protein [Lachnospiraceae bacterium]